jgi:hypothetical protein
MTYLSPDGPDLFAKISRAWILLKICEHVKLEEPYTTPVYVLIVQCTSSLL